VVLLAHRGADRNAAIEMADRILEELGSSFCVDGNDIWMGASIGISMYPEDGRDVTELLRNADVAMYEAKASGRNTHRRYNAAMLERTVAARAMEHDLRRAVANGEMFMQFQPIIDLRRGCLSHVEALLRWQCPKRGLVSPADFIPVAEASGLIDDIGDWVFEECCRQVRAWMDAGVEVGVAINVSARQVPRGLPIRRIRELLDKYQVPTRLVLIEITESVLLGRSSLVSGWINAAQALGIRLMIDDFGTGYSSLSYLKHFRLEALKVDKSFVGDVVSNHDDQTLVRAILAMSRSLGVAVIAEGVETEAQLHWLRENGCDYAQGYLLGRPQSAHATLEYALSNNVCMFFEDTRPSMLTEL
jgi:EAL domain-containing protein (putative c-di-GMP-specific phosphodiesterase class I)